ncbi:MAG TPA: kelch repeat-containing protein [Acidimicrobiales bacterium]|nr:kelch repeat-containing protein [Acidimicrobiales bacterium]
MPSARNRHTATLLVNGEVLLSGGDGDEPLPPIKVADDIDGDGREESVPYPAGFSQTTSLDSALLFDPVANAGRGSWRDAGTMGKIRIGHSAILLADGTVLVADAADEPPFPSDIFVPGPKGAAGAWRPAGAMVSTRGPFHMTRLPDGRVLATGGSSTRADAEVFDPEADGGVGAWSPAGAMGTPREQTSATLLEHDCGAYCGMVLVAGGITMGPINSEHVISTEVFDPASESWSPGPPMAHARGTHVAVGLLDGTVLLVGGGGSTAAAELFDRRAPRPALGVTGVSPGSGTTRGGTTITVTTPPSAQGVVEVRVSTPEATSVPSEVSTFSYETSTWAPLSETIGRYAHEAVLLDPTLCRGPADPPAGYPCGEVLVAGGTTDFKADSTQALDTAQLYKPGDRSLTTTGSMTTGGRYFFTATLLDGSRCASGSIADLAYPCGRVLVAGGRRGGGGVTTAEVYDPVAGTWAPTLGRLTEFRLSHTATLLDGPACRAALPPAYCGTVLVAGGATQELERPPIASAELYDAVSGVWKATGAMGTARTNHSATLLDGPACHQSGPPGYCGQVLVTGGLGPAGGVGAATCDRRPPSPSCPGETALTSAELYDPATGLWSPTGEMSVARLGHTATELDVEPCGTNCGKVLATGGANGHPYLTIESSELYDPAAGTWSPTTSTLHEGRVGHTATLLPDGTVMAAGGALPFHDTRLPSLTSAEIFDPVAGRWDHTLSLTGGRGLHSATLLTGPACRSQAASDAARWCSTVLLAGGYSWKADSHNQVNDLVEPDQIYRPTHKVTGFDPGSGPSTGGGSVTIRARVSTMSGRWASAACPRHSRSAPPPRSPPSSPAGGAELPRWWWRQLMEPRRH